ncbi:MAG TPA: hypothetical protein DCE12_00490 [Gammaproteobacteria bacterium]|nr:hypothetical protein [Gammaproteobacteria bacterium]
MACKSDQRKKLELLCRYITRPAIAEHTFEKLIGHISNLNRIQNLEVLVWPGVIHFNDRNIQVQRP